MLPLPTPGMVNDEQYPFPTGIIGSIIGDQPAPQGYTKLNRYSWIHNSTKSTFTWSKSTVKDICGRNAYHAYRFSVNQNFLTPGCILVPLTSVNGSFRVPFGLVWDATNDNILTNTLQFSMYHGTQA